MIRFFKPIILLLLLSIPVNRLLAQENKPLRVEIPWESKEEPFALAQCEDQGVILFYATNLSKEKNTTLWVFDLYDKNLDKLWTANSMLVRSNKYFENIYHNGMLYLLFYNNDKNKTSNIQLLKITLATRSFDLYTGQIQSNSNLTVFKIFEDKAIFGFETEKSAPELYFLDLTKNEWKSSAQEGDANKKVISIEKDNFSDNIMVISKSIHKKNQQAFISCYSKEGVFLNSTSIPISNEQYQISTADILSFDKDNKLLIGTFSLLSGISENIPDNIGEEAAGFFTLKIKNNIPDSGNFTPFYKLSNFSTYSYSNEGTKEKTKNDRKTKSGKEYNYNLLIHPAISYKNQYLLLAEAFHPEYHTERSLVYDYFGRPLTNTYTVFDGYRFSNAFVISINKDGYLLWDNGFEMWNILTLNLEKRAILVPDDEEMALTYSYEGQIAYKSIRENEIIDNISFTKIGFLYAKDELIDETSSSMVPWYGKYFLTYGYQKIKNNSMAENRRSVFYINKIAYE